MITNAPRQSGKTTRFVKQMALDDRLIYVAPLKAQCDWAFEVSKQLGYNLDRNRFVKMAPDLHRKYPRKRLLVDEAQGSLEWLIREFTGLEVHEAVMTVEMEDF